LLIVDDDADLRILLAGYFRRIGYEVEEKESGLAALEPAVAGNYDCFIFDVSMPGMTGIDLLKRVRDRGVKTPAMFLTAHDSIDDKVAGFEAGADDYLGKPFDLAEVEARLRALVRRAKGTEDIVLLGQLKLDRKARRFSTASGPLDLPAREFEGLWELMSPPGRTVSKRALSDKLSSFDESLGDNALEAFISRLRKKLVGSGAGIRTLRGIGYLLEADV